MPLCPSLRHSVAARNRPYERGFTAIELMVVVAIVAILAALAGPSFTPLIESWRGRQAAAGLESSLYFARSEAIKRGGNVVIQKIPNSGSCSLAPGASDWGCGWEVCADANRNNLCEAAEILQRANVPSNTEVTRTAGGATIQLNRWGLVAGPFVGFNVVPLHKSISNPAARGVCMSSGGRIRTISSVDLPCSG
jgi:type IV fimbrial biogenesis protein FimT